ncbi:hypothetical protein SAMN05421837_106361 [Amycolatopsis pretoriensis]|uniref:Uncharacterized protein n=1 Tax=Amycolatopsis pretoriensis TaxID=218821 RepID=A0A1H5R2T0_9PSEU|nr:hypothetical protein [Amycolatopsis pretoriensis]SEF32645.1 hypothetical protein SAMN05421837_106361 [Amycolatopsis pretoriensis]
MARTTVAALAGALVVTAGAVAFAGASSAVGPSPAPIVQAAQATCLTDGTGVCTVTHSLGKVPEAIVVSPNTPSPNNAFTLNTVLGSYTATTFQVRAMFNQTTPKTFGQIWFTYAAYGSPTAPPPTTTPKTTPQTTTPPPPTSSDPTSTPTTGGGS